MSDKLRTNEDEFFLRQSAEQIRAERERLNAQRQQSERRAHFMKCPKCGGDLAEREYHHVKIDECKDCGGIWLDKGELQMIDHVERNHVSRFIGNLLGLKH